MLPTCEKTLTKIDAPLERIVWREPNELIANDYNPNVVLPTELELLELSLRKHGWIQPILVSDNNIIDGFHRWWISQKNNWLVPCIEMQMSREERMLLTIRINRAKGTHVALRMSAIIKSLVQSGLSLEYIGEQIGATLFEVKLLLEDSVFSKLEIEKHQYGPSWTPKKRTKNG
jgi:hypothetical protein